VIISLLNQKGGCGKTTLATHLAGDLASPSAHVLLVDADPQGSALDWSQKRVLLGLPRRFGVVGLSRETLHQEVPQIARHAEHVIIDGPPRVTALARSAILASDLVIVPVQPSPYDVWACNDIVSLITEAKIFKPGLRAAFVVNRRIVGTVIGRDVRTALGEYPLRVLHSVVSQRVLFAECAATGQLANEIDSRSTAAREISAFSAEIRALMQWQPSA
jgi:chromosome partitioning protein